jgi:Raf kinase inhibitor-like YbhB/YbcL family protein
MRLVAASALSLLALSGCGGGGGAAVTTGPAVGRFSFTGASDVHPGQAIPTRFTCDGQDVSPKLVWTGVPEGAQELALALDDPDAPGGTFTHWLVWGIDPTSTTLAGAGSAPEGRNDFGKNGYGGPCPPRGQTHHYVFRLLALDARVDLPAGADRSAFDKAVTPHVLAEARVTATYSRK